MDQRKCTRTSGRLIVGKGAEARGYSLEHLPFTLGRSAERNLAMGDPRVSRDHAFIDCDADGYFIRDQGSRHGTFVNGVMIGANQSRLRNGDKIVLGMSSEAILFEESEGDSTTRTLLAKISRTGAGESQLETLSLFLQAAQSLSSHGAVNDVLRTMVEYTIRLTQAERGFVFLGASAAEFELAYGRDEEGKDLTEYEGISTSIVRDAAESDQDFVLGDASEEAAKEGRESLILHDIRSVAAIPLRGLNSGRLLGMLYLDSRTGRHGISLVSKEILHVIARQAATLLENLTMLEREREAALLRKELEIAATIQREIIPRTLPEIEGVRLTARTVPCTGVGGDFYDVIPVPDGFVAVVADVCGKGVPAALLASMVQGMLHAQITSGATLVEAVTRVSAFVCSRTPVEKYVTLALLRYTQADGGGGKVELVNGGHCSPMIVRANGQVETVRDGDMPVGLLSEATFHAIACSLSKGDQMVLLSDGVSEAENVDGEMFGKQAMGDVFAEAGDDPVRRLFGALGEFCDGMAAQDDQTVLVIEVAG